MFKALGTPQELPRSGSGSTLRVLAIGVGEYERAQLPLLHFAAKDARDIALALRSQSQLSYQNVLSTVLINSDANRRTIKSAVEHLWKDARPEDVTVLFIAGHGINHCDTYSYFFAPYDFDETCYSDSAIEGAWLCRALWMVPGRRILIADTCNAGNIVDNQFELSRARTQKLTTLIRQVGATHRQPPMERAKARSSFVVLAATGQDTPATESERWENGAFTKALLEGLHGGGDNCAGSVTVRMLASYVKNRVRTLTLGTQEPVFALAAGSDEDWELLRLSPGMMRQGLDAGDPLIGRSVGGFQITARIEQTPRYVLYSAASVGEQPQSAQLRALSLALSSDPAELSRFCKGATALRLLGHPGFVAIHEQGRLPDGRAHVTLGTEGRLRLRLRDVLQCGEVPQEAVANIVSQLATTLAAAHRGGVLYLSLTPSRILADEELRQFLLYDGENTCLARSPTPPLQRQPDERILDSTDSAHYQAPECSAALPSVSERTDTYALGILWYHLLTGRPPYMGETIGRLREAQKHPLPPLRMLGVAVSPDVEALIGSMVAADPALRPSMKEVEQFWHPCESDSPSLPSQPPTLVQPAPPSLPLPTMPHASVTLPYAELLTTVQPVLCVDAVNQHSQDITAPSLKVQRQPLTWAVGGAMLLVIVSLTAAAKLWRELRFGAECRSAPSYPARSVAQDEQSIFTRSQSC